MSVFSQNGRRGSESRLPLFAKAVVSGLFWHSRILVLRMRARRGYLETVDFIRAKGLPMNARFCLALILLMLSPPAYALEARIETPGGVPTLMVNGKPMPPFILFHTAGGGPREMACRTGPKWRQFSFSFVAPRDDDNVGIHIRNIVPAGNWFVDDARFFEGRSEAPTSPNRLRGGDFEGPKLPEAWKYFLNASTGAACQYSLDTTDPHEGNSCLRVCITRPGTIGYQIHIYQCIAIRKGKTYTFSVWLRSEEPRTIAIQAVHQGPPWNMYGGQTSASDNIVALGAKRGLHIGTVPIGMPWPRDGESPDYSAADAQVRHILSIDPKALIIPRIGLHAPQWWKHKHPEQQQVYDGGRRPMVSPASKLWRRDAAHALRLFLRHLEDEFGDSMLGYHPCAQSAGEWFYDHTWERIMPCFEEPFRVGFAEWVKAKYKTVDALQKAWDKPEVVFETIRVPTLDERLAGKLGVFRDARSQRFEIDFAQYMQVCLCEYLEECAKIVKQETGGKKLGVFFYGYLYDVSGFAYGPAVSGHLRLHRALNCPDIDILCSPISYFDRQSGGVGPFMAPVDSIQAHGKLWLNEDDARTHLAPKSAGFGRTSTMAETIGVYRRNFGHQFERRCATWWMDFGTGWMADPTIFDNFRKTREIWLEAATPEPYQPQVAMIIDEDSLLYMRNSNDVTRPSISRIRRMFNTMGCPVGLYLMEDVRAGKLPESVRLIVLLNAYRVTKQQREELLAQVARQGKVAVWLYAPGLIDERAAAANVSRLIGFEVTRIAEPKSGKARLVGNAAKALGVAEGHIFGTTFVPSPLFAVRSGQPDVVALGTYEGGPDIAMAMKRLPDWTSVFCGTLEMSSEVLRGLARLAAAHIYCDTNDVISARPGFLSIHATATGQKTLVFPREVRLRDLYTGEELTTARKRCTFTMVKGETRAFAWK